MVLYVFHKSWDKLGQIKLNLVYCYFLKLLFLVIWNTGLSPMYIMHTLHPVFQIYIFTYNMCYKNMYITKYFCNYFSNINLFSFFSFYIILPMVGKMDSLNVYIKCIHKYISHIPYLGLLYQKGAQLVFKFKKKTLYSRR